MTSLMATRVICDSMAHLVVSGQLPRKGKPTWISDDCNMNVDRAEISHARSRHDQVPADLPE